MDPILYLFDARNLLIHAAPGMPPFYWHVTGIVLLILAATAIIDIFVGIVPDMLLLPAMLAVIAAQAAGASIDDAITHLIEGLITGFLVWGVNEVWYRFYHHDALGMGDAKWTVLAVACFGIVPGLFAWGLGSVLALCFIGAMKLAHRRVTQVTFAPFLFAGLVLGLYWTRFAA